MKPSSMICRHFLEGGKWILHADQNSGQSPIRRLIQTSESLNGRPSRLSDHSPSRSSSLKIGTVPLQRLIEAGLVITYQVDGKTALRVGNEEDGDEDTVEVTRITELRSQLIQES